MLCRRGEPCFYAFDLLWLNGHDLRERPLLEHKRALRRIIPAKASAVRYLDLVRAQGIELFREVCRRDLEGIVAKLASAAYVDASPPG